MVELSPLNGLGRNVAARLSHPPAVHAEARLYTASPAVRHPVTIRRIAGEPGWSGSGRSTEGRNGPCARYSSYLFLDPFAFSSYDARMRAHGSLDSVASILDGLARRLGLENHLFEMRLRREWADIVGDQIAAHTRPEQIRFKKLLIHVRHSVWLQQLTFLKRELLGKINATAGETLVSEIILRIGEVTAGPSEAGRPADVAPVPIEPSSQTKAQAALYAQAVQDQALREHLAAVMAGALARSNPVS